MACRPPAQNRDAPRRTSPRRGIAPRTCAPCSRGGWRDEEGSPRRFPIIRHPSSAGRTIPRSAEFRSPPRRAGLCRGNRGGPTHLALAQHLPRRSPVQGRHAFAQARDGAAGHRRAARRRRGRRQFQLGLRPGEPARNRRHHDPHRHARPLAGAGRSYPLRGQCSQSEQALPLPRHRRRPCNRGRRSVAAGIAGLRRRAVLGHAIRLRQRRRRDRAKSIYRRYVATRPVAALGQALRPRVPRSRLRRGARLLAQTHRAHWRSGTPVSLPAPRSASLCCSPDPSSRSGAIVSRLPCRRSWPRRRDCRGPNSGRPADRGEAGASGPACRPPPGGGDGGGRGAVLDPVDQSRQPVEPLRSDAAAAVEHAGHHRTAGRNPACRRRWRRPPSRNSRCPSSAAAPRVGPAEVHQQLAAARAERSRGWGRWRSRSVRASANFAMSLSKSNFAGSNEGSALGEDQ